LIEVHLADFLRRRRGKLRGTRRGSSGGFHGSKTGLANNLIFTTFVYVFTSVDSFGLLGN
jgi:hypothetical protein